MSRRDYDAIAQPTARLPQIRINFGNQGLLLGTEQNRHVNEIMTKENSLFFAGSYFVGDHTLKFGVDYAENDIFNYYGRNQNGTYTFASLATFIARNPTNYDYRAPLSGGYADIPAQFTIKNTGFFLQDTWAINYNLNLLFGLRGDKPSFGGTPIHNACLSSAPNSAGTGAAGCAFGGFGYDNRTLIDGILWQPRFGFNYTFDSERPTQLRGGVGLFQGGNPNVWLAGPFQNTGRQYVEYQVSNSAGIGPIFSPEPDNQPTNFAGGARQNIDIVHPDLKQPSVWKANLAFDHELPWGGLVASAELLLTKVKDAIYMERLDLGTPNTVRGPDGRVMYWNANGLDAARWAQSRNGIGSNASGATQRFNRLSYVGDAILLRNTNQGRSEQLTVSIEKPMTENWSWLLGYTYTAAKEVSPLTSSQNTSNWNNNPLLNANEEVLNNSRYAIRIALPVR